MEVPEEIQALPGQEPWCTVTQPEKRSGSNTLLLLQLPMLDWNLEAPPVPDTTQSFCSLRADCHTDLRAHRCIERSLGALICSCTSPRREHSATVAKAFSHAQLAIISEHLGNQTNNYAEYTGLIRGLQAALACGVKRIRIKGDSKLVVMQVRLGPHFDQLCASQMGHCRVGCWYGLCHRLYISCCFCLRGQLSRFGLWHFADERSMAGAQRRPGTAPQAGLCTEEAL